MKPVTRYALLPGLAVLVLTLLLMLLAHRIAIDRLGERTQETLQLQADTLARQLDAGLHGARREVTLLARSPLLRPDRPAATLRAELAHLHAQWPAYLWLGLVAPDGTVLAGTRGWLEGKSIATRPVFAQARAGTFVGDVHPTVALKPLLAEAGLEAQEVIDIGEPVRDADGQVVAVLAVHLGVDWVERLRDRALGHGAHRPQVFVMTGDGGRSVLPGAQLPAGVAAALASASLVRAQDGERYFVARAALGEPGQPALLPWQVVMLQPRDDALAPVLRILTTMAALGTTAALLVAGVGAWLARRVLEPWGPLFDAVLARAGDHADARAVAAAVDDVLRDQATAASGPEALLARLASDARELGRIFDHLPVGLALIDRDFRVEYLNPQYTRLLGWTTEQVRGRIAAEFLFDAAERGNFVRLFDQLGNPPGEVVARFDALRPDGDRVAVQWHLVPMVENDGRLAGAIAVVQDVRPERLARARADALAGRLRALADAAVDDALATLDLDGRVLEWSRGAERISGHAAGEAIGRRLGELLPPAALHEQAMLQARREGRCPIAAELTAADGRTRWFEGSIYALGLAPGSARFGVILRDLSDQREVHRALARSEERLRLALQSAVMGTWDLEFGDGAPRVHWSQDYAQTFGVPPHLLPATDREMYALMHPDDREAVREAILATLRDDRPLDVQFRIPVGGTMRWHAIHGAAVRREDGRVVRLIGVGHDVTERKLGEAELRAGRERLERIVQTMAEGLVVLDAQGCYTLVNHAAEHMLGVAADQVVGRRYDEVPWKRFDADGQPVQDGHHAWRRLRDGETEVRGETVIVEGAGGERIVTSLNAQPVHDDGGAFVGAVLTFIDISERQQAERALADSRARLSAIIAGASDAIVSTDAEGRVTLFNPAAERIFGQAVDTMLGQPLTRLMPPRSRQHGEHVAHFASSGISRRAMGPGHVQGLHADGRLIELEASISQAEVHGERVLTAILRDVTERMRQQQEIEAARTELAQLTRQLLEQEKQTTRRLAQALHDELGQTLSALRLHWDALAASAGGTAGPLHARVSALVDSANQQIRGVLGELRPPMLDDFGLVAAIDNEMQRQQPVGGKPALALQVPARLQHARWPAGVEYAAFMIAREALTNALHHAKAATVVVSLDGDDGQLNLQIEDDGIGLGDPAGHAVASRPGHLGLVGMRERALAIGATLEIIGNAPGGTRVSLTWNASDEPDLPDR